VAGRRSNRTGTGLKSRERAGANPLTATNLDEVRWGIPPRPLQEPLLDRHKCLVVYNTEVAWSEAAADYWAARHGVVSHKVGVALGASVPSADTVLDLRGTEYAALLAPVYAYVMAHGIEAVFMAPGTPTRMLVDKTLGGTAEWNLATFVGCVRYITEYRQQTGAAFPKGSSVGDVGKCSWAVPSYSGSLNGDVRCASRQGNQKNYITPNGTPPSALFTPADSAGTVARVIAQTSTDYGTDQPPDGIPILACGRIGRPRFQADAALPNETYANACAVIDQAVEYETSLEAAVAQGLTHQITVSTRVPVDMPDWDPAAIVDYGRSLGLTVKYGTKGSQSTFAAAVAPTAGQDYSVAGLLAGTARAGATWFTGGYGLENEPLSNTALQNAYEFHPGAWGFESTSFSWLHVARIQRGGGIGGLGHTGEPYSTDAGSIWAFWFNALHGMTLAEAHFRGKQQMPWQACVFGDPLYRPFGRSE